MNSTTCCHPTLNIPFFGTFAPSSSAHQAHFALLVGELFFGDCLSVDWFVQSINTHDEFLRCSCCVGTASYIRYSFRYHRSPTAVVLGVSFRLRWTSTTTDVLQYSSTLLHCDTAALYSTVLPTVLMTMDCSIRSSLYSTMTLLHCTVLWWWHCTPVLVQLLMFLSSWRQRYVIVLVLWHLHPDVLLHFYSMLAAVCCSFIVLVAGRLVLLFFLVVVLHSISHCPAFVLLFLLGGCLWQWMLSASFCCALMEYVLLLFVCFDWACKAIRPSESLLGHLREILIDMSESNQVDLPV